MCIFCEIVKGNIPCYKVYEDEKCLAFLDISQATIGHTLVVPKKHYDDIFDIDCETSKHLFEIVTKISKNMKSKLCVEAINIINNSGELSGQAVKHFHIHIIPRTKGDKFEIKNVENKLTKEEFEDLASKLSM